MKFMDMLLNDIKIFYITCWLYLYYIKLRLIFIGCRSSRTSKCKDRGAYMRKLTDGLAI